jgi:hypothetical protein
VFMSTGSDTAIASQFRAVNDNGTAFITIYWECGGKELLLSCVNREWSKNLQSRTGSGRSAVRSGVGSRLATRIPIPREFNSPARRLHIKRGLSALGWHS